MLLMIKSIVFLRIGCCFENINAHWTYTSGFPSAVIIASSSSLINSFKGFSILESMSKYTPPYLYKIKYLQKSTFATIIFSLL